MRPFAGLSGLLFLAACSFAQDFDAAVGSIVPGGVRLGMGVAEIKQARPATFEGPPASSPTGVDLNTYRTLIEVQNVGAPGHLSYWYLCSHEQVVGVLRTRSLVGIAPETATLAAQQMYSQFVEKLGTAREETLLRKGGTAFVPVRADVWISSESGRTIYFIATNKEMTVAVVEATDFPLAQVFIKPDPQRFPLEEPDKRSVLDLERPIAMAVVSPVPSNPATSLSEQTPKGQPIRGYMKAMPPNSPVATSIHASLEKTRGSAFWTLVLVIGGAVIATIVVLLKRRRES